MWIHLLLFESVVGMTADCVQWTDSEAIACLETNETCGCIAAAPGCDVWWRWVSADVIPPIPELAVALPGSTSGVCRAGTLGLLGTQGGDFGKCLVDPPIDGGGFEILQARRHQRGPCPEPRIDRLRQRIDGMSTEDLSMLQSVVGSLDVLDAVNDLDGCEVRDVLSDSRFVPHELNALGLHVLRALLADGAKRRRMENGNEDWRRDGLIVRPFESDQQLYALLKSVGGLDVQPPPYEWVARNVTTVDGDAQNEPHLDTFASVVKVWLFAPPLDDRHGPFTYVKGTHRNSESKLRWMYAYSTSQAALREPSFRLHGDEGAATAAADFVAHCQKHARPVLPLDDAHLTLVIADTSAIHFRAPGLPGFVRQSFRLKGDNGGGLPRRNPFRWPDDDIFPTP